MKKLLLTLLSILFVGLTQRGHSQMTTMPETDTPDMVKVYVKQDPATYQKTSHQSTHIDFAVQVSASSKPVAETAARKEWAELGHVYVQMENGLYKVRIGPFATQMEAKEILMQAKSKGRKDAFIVVLQGTENDKPIFQAGSTSKSAPQPKAEKKVVAEPAMTKTTPTPAETSTSEYKVRVASYEKPGGFNPNGIEKLGTLESYRKGNLTIMMIGGFKTLPDAQKAREVVVSKGFKDASIVVEHEGILEEVVIQ